MLSGCLYTHDMTIETSSYLSLIGSYLEVHLRSFVHTYR
jgi:hypothetical protein